MHVYDRPCMYFPRNTILYLVIYITDFFNRTSFVLEFFIVILTIQNS